MSNPKVVIKRSERPVLTLFIAFVLVAAPATISTSWYYITGSIGARPLALTREYEALNGIGNEIAIIAEIQWSASSSGRYSKQQMKQLLQQAFYRHGEGVVVFFRDVETPETNITYKVGRNTFGPVRFADAARYVRPAIDALRLHRR